MDGEKAKITWAWDITKDINFPTHHRKLISLSCIGSMSLATHITPSLSWTSELLRIFRTGQRSHHTSPVYPWQKASYPLHFSTPMGTTDPLQYTLQHFIHFASDSNNDDCMNPNISKKPIKKQGRWEILIKKNTWILKTCNWHNYSCRTWKEERRWPEDVQQLQS